MTGPGKTQSSTASAESSTPPVNGQGLTSQSSGQTRVSQDRRVVARKAFSGKKHLELSNLVWPYRLRPLSRFHLSPRITHVAVKRAAPPIGGARRSKPVTAQKVRFLAQDDEAKILKKVMIISLVILISHTRFKKIEGVPCLNSESSGFGPNCRLGRLHQITSPQRTTEISSWQCFICSKVIYLAAYSFLNQIHQTLVCKDLQVF